MTTIIGDVLYTKHLFCAAFQDSPAHVLSHSIFPTYKPKYYENSHVSAEENLRELRPQQVKSLSQGHD